MNPHIEILMTAFIVGSCALALLRRMVRFVSQADSDGCGTGCGSCSSQGQGFASETMKPLVPLEVSTGSRGRKE